jgi:chromosome segregation ATPase
MSKFTDAGRAYLPDMTRDAYYPPHVVAKVREQLERLVEWLEQAPRSNAEIQMRCDVMTENINELEGEFDEAGSEIETVAREDIAATVSAIFEVYGVTVSTEDAIGARNW